VFALWDKSSFFLPLGERGNHILEGSDIRLDGH
jgi:hypothetical protein